jgi:hypothetical protein
VGNGWAASEGVRVKYAANPSTQAVRDEMNAGRLVCISTPKQGNKIPEDALVCLDNGAYGKGFPGEEKWFAWVAKHRPIADRVLFVTAPDVVGDAEATYERSLPWLPKIRALGLKAAYVAQDGQELFEPPWDEMDCLFIGGTTDWKLGEAAAALVGEAKRRGKWVHAGRVNSQKRFTYFDKMGCDSADGTFIAFGPDINLPKALKWVDSSINRL